MRNKIASLLLVAAMAGAFFAGPALAYDRAQWRHEWREHHPTRAYGPAYAYDRWRPGYWRAPVPPSRHWHWRLIDGHWRWVP